MLPLVHRNQHSAPRSGGIRTPRQRPSHVGATVTCVVAGNGSYERPRMVLIGILVLCTLSPTPLPGAADDIRQLQKQAIDTGASPALHWGVDPGRYTEWGSHSNRLVPVYTFGTRGAGRGIDLTSYTGENSPYRSEEALRRIYGRVPEHTLNPEADYFDQTNVADLQQAALAAGRKYIFLVVFDGMDWETTRAAAIYNSASIAYNSGRGTGLHFLDYEADGTTQFGYAVASPSNELVITNADKQTVINTGASPGGYNAEKGGPTPWTAGSHPRYLTRKSRGVKHAIPDSAATATAMNSGVKTFNRSINVDRAGGQLTSIAHRAQDEGYAIGAVSSVPISHATPAAAYAHNVSRYDCQDLARDLLGRPSISHPDRQLSGFDVLIGGGYGTVLNRDKPQGSNYVQGNRYLTSQDLKAIDVRNGGKYTVAVRTAGTAGAEGLRQAAQQAIRDKTRLLGFYGVGKYEGHLPYRTANGDYLPTLGKRKVAEEYTAADVRENPTLAEMTTAALDVLSRNPKGFWLLVESGDVDWANHDNNIDNSIGAVLSGDAAVKVITDWVEQNSNWDESLLIVTSDHGHFLVIDQPEALIPSSRHTTETAD